MAHHHRIRLLVVLYLFLALLVPAGAKTAAAQADECEEGFVYVEDEDLCVPEDEVPADDETDTEDIEEDTTDLDQTEDADDQTDEEDAGLEEPGYIAEFTLEHFVCDPGFDPLQNKDNWEGLVRFCIGAAKPAFTYDIYVDQEYINTVGLQTFDDSWGVETLPGPQEEPIPAGALMIVASPVDGYTTRWVMCTAWMEDGSTRKFEPPINNGGAVSFGLDPGEGASCEWYNVPIDSVPLDPTPTIVQDGSTSFSVTKYACESDARPDPQEDPWSYYSASCTDTIAGQEFTLQEGEDGPTRQETGADGTFYLTDIPVTDPSVPPVWNVSERIPAGYGEPIVFCGPVGETKQVMTLSNGNAITLAYENGVSDLACDWFNIPGEGQPATISIQSWLCDTVNLAEEELADSCTQPATDTSFSLLSEGETINSLSTDEGGAVTFEGVAPGELAIVEDLPSGYGPVMVTCDHASTAFGQQQITPNIQYGNGFTIEIDAGDVLDCDWYNLPALGEDNGPNIAIQGYQCPPSTAVTADTPLDEALAQCINPAFSTTYDVMIGEEMIASAYSGGSGQVFFTKLPSLQDGEIYSLTMSTSETDEVLSAWCDKDNGDDNYVTFETPLLDGNRIDFDLLDGTNMRCTWFYKLGVITTPEPPNPGGGSGDGASDITIVARLCEPEIETMRGDLADLCPYPGPGVDFELSTDGEATEAGETDVDGVISFPAATDGASYLVNNLPKAGYSEPAVECTVTDIDGATEAIGGPVLADSPGFSFDLEAGSSITCTFYFVIDVDALEPDEDDPDNGDAATNSVTVQFWICPGAISEDPLQEDLLVECTPELEDRDLVVSIAGESNGQAITGIASWEFEGSDFTLDTGSDEQVSVWCSSTWIEDGEEVSEFPVVKEVTNGILSLPIVNPDTTVYCDWFVADSAVENQPALVLPEPDMNIDFPGVGQGLTSFSIAQYGCLPAFDVTPPLPNPVPLGDLYCQGAALPSIQYAVEIKGTVYFNTALEQSGVSSVYEYPNPIALSAGTTRILAITPAQFQILQVDCTSGPGNSVHHDNLAISADGWISFDTTPGSDVWCSFRVGPTAAWQGAQIKINSYTCNQGFDLYTTDANQRSSSCELDDIPISFDATLGGAPLGFITYDGDGWGEKIATPTQAGGTGTLRLTQPFVDGYGGMPRAYCTIFAPDGATNLEPTMIDGGSIEIQAPNNSLVVCEWFRPLKTIG